MSRSTLNDDCLLEQAVARYEEFLHLIKRKREKSIPSFCVPTSDIDLVWHSHQLCPLPYSRDLKAMLGKIVNNNDRDSSNGDNLKIRSKEIAKLWEEMFGREYITANLMSCNSQMKCFAGYDSEGSVRSTPCASECVDLMVQAAECCNNCVDG